MSELPKTPSRRGFAGMTPEKRREISAMGGASLKPDQRSFSQDPKLAERAGRKGGQVSRKNRGGPQPS